MSMGMQEYRPPVKTSVKILHSDRISTIQSVSTTSTHHRSENMLPGKQQHSRKRFLSSSWKSSHAVGFALPLPDCKSASGGVISFERRMRELVLGRQRKQSDIGPIQDQHRNQERERYDSVESHLAPSNVVVINSLEEYKRIVGDERKLMVVARFFASYCKACKAVAPHFYKIARDYVGRAVFVEVPVNNKNSLLHQGLGIPSLPYAHIYHPQTGLVDELSFTRKNVSDLARKLAVYLEEVEQ